MPRVPVGLRQRLDTARTDPERGAVGWLMIGIVLGAILVIWLIVQLIQGIF
jgi:hypothetical protein